MSSPNTSNLPPASSDVQIVYSQINLVANWILGNQYKQQQNLDKLGEEAINRLGDGSKNIG